MPRTITPSVSSCSLRACRSMTALVAAPRWRRAGPGTTVLAASLSLVLAACGTGTAPAPSDLAQAPGSVELNQAPPDDVPPGGGGTGTVFFHGNIYHFAIGGLGIDGSAVAIIQTSGKVYRLVEITRFPGTYRRAPAASVIPGQGGGLWLQNEHATVLHLSDPPQGRMPDIGDDALRVVLDQ
jgi:hypothetical protein